MDRPPGDEKGAGHGGVVEGAGDGSASLATTLSCASDCFAVVPGRKQEQVSPQAPMPLPSMGLAVELEQETLLADHADGRLLGSYQGLAVAAVELRAQVPWTKGDDGLVTLVHNPGCELPMEKDNTTGLTKIAGTHFIQSNEANGVSLFPEDIGNSGPCSLCDYAPSSTMPPGNGDVSKVGQASHITNNAKNLTQALLPCSHHQYQCLRSRVPRSYGIPRPSVAMSLEDSLSNLRNMTSQPKPAADIGDSENMAKGISGPDSLCDCVLSTKTAAIGNVNNVGHITKRINDAMRVTQIWEQELSRREYLNWLAIKEFFQSEYHQARIRPRNLETRTEKSNVTYFHNEKATKENKTSLTKAEGISVADSLCECTPSIKTAGNGNKGEQKSQSRNSACSLTQFFVKVCGKQLSMLEDLNTTTVEEMIQSACHKAGIMACDMFATYGGKPLKPKKSIACYPIFKNSTVHIRSRLRAGRIPDINSETFDELLSTNLGMLFHKVNLSQLATNQKSKRTSATFLSTFIAYHIRQILVFLCGRHRAGQSFDGKFESKDIIVFNRTMVMFDTSVTEVTFTPSSCSNDFLALYKIFSSDTFKDSGEYPLYYKHFLNLLFTCPAKGDSNAEPFIQFLTNHPALTSYTDRVKQFNLLDSIVHHLYTNDLSKLDRVAGYYLQWVNDVKDVPAMDIVYHYKATLDQKNQWIVNGKYTVWRLGCLHFARNYFNHVYEHLNLEEADAAFAETLEDFLPDLLERIAIGHAAAPAYVDILTVLGNPLADSFSGQ